MVSKYINGVVMIEKNDKRSEQGSNAMEIRQYKPGDKLKKQIEDHIRENLGVGGELVELIEISDQRYADQIMVANEIATGRFLQDANTQKARVTERTPTGSQTIEYCPIFVTQLGITTPKDKTTPKPHIAIQRNEHAKPHEFRLARKYIMEQTNKVLEMFDRPTLNLKDPSELQ